MALDALTPEDREGITILLERKTGFLTEWETDFLHGIRLRATLSEAQRGTFESIWNEIMEGRCDRRDD